jgi:hypothetical protein
VQEAWLDRVTGRVCLAISARGMAITGIDDRRYWNWIPTEESRLDLSFNLLEMECSLTCSINSAICVLVVLFNGKRISFGDQSVITLFS